MLVRQSAADDAMDSVRRMYSFLAGACLDNTPLLPFFPYQRAHY